MDADTKTITGLLVEPGVVIAKRYEVCDRLGAGGVGMVYKAIDRELDGEVVALKLLLPHLAQDETVFRRFRNEVLVARALSHPNIVRTHDMGRAEGGYSYISMEYVDGVSLKDKLSTRTPEGEIRPSLSFDEALAIMYQIISGVSYAHGKGVIHRDLKPANVLISKAGEVKLADFGTARIMGMDTSLTQTGQVIGTPDYMSPEQIRGEQLDPSCDIYALGIMSYELMVGLRPFMADSSVAVAFKHLNDPIPPFASNERNIPVWFEEVVRKACAKKKSDRFTSVMELASTLLDYAPQLSVQSTFFSVTRTITKKTTGTDFSELPTNGRGLKTAPNGQSESRDYRFELGSGPPAVDEGWKLGTSGLHDSGESDAPTLETSAKDSSTIPRVVGLLLGLLCAFLVFAAAATRMSSSLSGFAREQLSAVAIANPTLAHALAAVFGVSIEPKSPPGPRPLDLAATTPSARSDQQARDALERELGDVANSASSPEIKPKEADPTPTGRTETPPAVQSVAKTVSPEAPAEPAKETVKVPEPPVEPVKAPEPPPVPLTFTGALNLKEGTRPISDDSVSVDRLSQVRWTAALTVTGELPESFSNESVRQEFSVNVFDLRRSAVVAKLRIEQVQLPTAQDPELRLGGTMAALKGTSPSAGSFRLDLVRAGEVISSRDLVLYRASVTTTSPAVNDSRVAIVRGAGVSGGEPAVEPPPVTQQMPVRPPETPLTPPIGVSQPDTGGSIVVRPPDPQFPTIAATTSPSSGLPPAIGHQHQVPVEPAVVMPPAVTENYGGFFRIPAGDGAPEEKRAMILNIEIRGVEVSGNATIAGYETFQVTGRMLSRGMELELRNSAQYVRLTTGRRDRELRGLYSFPSIQKKGNWEVTRTN